MIEILRRERGGPPVHPPSTRHQLPAGSERPYPASLLPRCGPFLQCGFRGKSVCARRS
jgi:hypothetical protein